MDDLLDKVSKSQNGVKIKALMSGDMADYYKDGSVEYDRSKAEMALAGHLAYFSQDADQLERIMSSCELCNRAKWHNRPDYRKN